MNPCPCGYLGDTEKACRCTSTQILQYQKRLSGPLLDRIDLTISLSRVPHEDLLAKNELSNTQHKQSSQLISQATSLQHKRYSCSGKYNSGLSSRDVDIFTPLDKSVHDFLLRASKNLDLSARSYFKVIKVARTIADLEGAEEIVG